MTMFWSSTYPSLPNPSRKTSNDGPSAMSRAFARTPMRWTLPAGCASAATGGAKRARARASAAARGFIGGSRSRPRSHRDGGTRDADGVSLALHPIRLAEPLGDALEREHVGDDALEGEPAQVAAQEGERLIERPRRVVGRGHQARIAAHQRGGVVGEDIAGGD